MGGRLRDPLARETPVQVLFPVAGITEFIVILPPQGMGLVHLAAFLDMTLTAGTTWRAGNTRHPDGRAAMLRFAINSRQCVCGRDNEQSQQQKSNNHLVPR